LAVIMNDLSPIRFSRTRDPRPAEGKLAVARLTPGYRGLNTNDVELKAAGFEPIGEGSWRHQDGSWVQRGSEGGQPFFCGVGQVRLISPPQMIGIVVRGTSILNERPPLDRKTQAWFKANTAMGVLDLSVRTYGDEVRKLTQAGFVLGKRSKTGDTWVHPDGSWAKVGTSSNTTGWKGYAMAELPKAHPLGHVLTERPSIPASMSTCALATLGRVSDGETKRLREAGFVRAGPLWIHPDGSWVKTKDNISVGWKGYPLSELPYSNSYGWGNQDDNN
jgi:hypothetical protein